MRLPRLAPALTLGLMAGPVAAGLAGTFGPALADGGAGFARLWDWPGLARAAALSAGTGLLSTGLALALTVLILSALLGRPGLVRLRHLIAPLLAVPHAAAALGLAFLIAPSGWILRLLSPEVTGWTTPPDLLILNDPRGLALVAGLVAKEVPFLLLMALAALPQLDSARRLSTAATLGHGRTLGFAIAMLPALYPALRLPVYAVLVYGMTAVDMGMILGPTLPPPLSVQIALWMSDPGLAVRDVAAAGAVVQLGLVLGALILWRGAERAAKRALVALAFHGWRGARIDAPAGLLARGAAGLVAGGLILALAGLVLWSVAGAWTFPDALPRGLTLRTWATAAPALAATTGTTLAIAALSTGAALVLALACLQAGAGTTGKAEPGAAGGLPGRLLPLVYLPLLVPQIAILPGLQGLALRLGIEGGLLAVAAAHLVFVLPYVLLTLAGPFAAWDRRIGIAAATLGAKEARIFWRLRLPMLVAPVMTAAAVGIAVSVGQYLPSLLIGGGRIETLTTEAVALASGGNRRLIGALAVLQMTLPALAFALAVGLPALIWRKRRGMQGMG